MIVQTQQRQPLKFVPKGGMPVQQRPATGGQALLVELKQQLVPGAGQGIKQNRSPPGQHQPQQQPQKAENNQGRNRLGGGHQHKQATRPAQRTGQRPGGRTGNALGQHVGQGKEGGQQRQQRQHGPGAGDGGYVDQRPGQAAGQTHSRAAQQRVNPAAGTPEESQAKGHANRQAGGQLSFYSGDEQAKTEADQAAHNDATYLPAEGVYLAHVGGHSGNAGRYRK